MLPRKRTRSSVRLHYKVMMDLIYVATTLGFFALSLVYLRSCESL
jgi:hypothetical protein